MNRISICCKKHLEKSVRFAIGVKWQSQALAVWCSPYITDKQQSNEEHIFLIPN